MGNRAHIFMPFDALKGFKEALKEKERIIVEKKDLTEDDYDLLNKTFKELKKGSMVKVVYYNIDSYIEYTGMVSFISSEERYIKVVKEKIPFDSIQSIRILTQ